MIKRNPASFRDPSGSVFEQDDYVYRTINASYRDNWEKIKEAGLLEKACAKGWLLPAKEIAIPPELKNGEVYSALRTEKLPFVSYPYEWSFSQLKAAALLTLDMQILALEDGFVLKDASAYNIIFDGVKPVFIDTLSFEIWRNDRPWEAYGQFCRHFLAPLALESYIGPDCGRFSRQWIDGIPLDLAATLMPAKARLSPGLLIHLFAHSKMQLKYADGRKAAEKTSKIRLSRQKMLDVADSLHSLVSALKPPASPTEWSDYYQDTNYSAQSMASKETIVANLTKKYCQKSGLAIDLGANNGHFSKLIAPQFKTVIAADIDPGAVEANFLHLCNTDKTNIVPLVQDLSSPSPALGWNLEERASFIQRAKGDLVLGLALCHHLYFSAGIPFDKMTEFFANIMENAGILCVEFVPADDSQVKRLLAARDVDTSAYTIENFRSACAENDLVELEATPVEGSKRIILVFRKS